MLPTVSTTTLDIRPPRTTSARFVFRGQKKILLGTCGIVGFLATWELIPRLGIVHERFLPPASEVVVELLTSLGSSTVWIAIGETLFAWFIGLSIAVIAAVLAGFLIGSSRFLKKATHSTIEFLRPVPSVALIPLAVLLFGARIESTLLLVIYAAFWPVLIQVLYGVADVDSVANDTAKSYRLGALARIRYVVWPTALPYLITGIRLAAAVALILAITAELNIGSPGLGKEIAVAQAGGAVTQMYALVLVTGLLGMLINSGLRFAEGQLLSWHISARKEDVV